MPQTGRSLNWVSASALAHSNDLHSLSVRSIAFRLFVTCWLVYGLHVATNTVREIYLALAIGDHFSFRVDEYAKIHPDLFEKPGNGWHIGANPGASMIAALPYAVARPLIDRLVRTVNERRAGAAEPPPYDSPWPLARRFYEEAWRRGYDIKFGLAALVMQWFCMAPFSAAGVVAMFLLLRTVLASNRAGLFGALLYAFGTPVFFRTGYLNHNLMIGHLAFIGFLLLWNPSALSRLSERTRYVLAGLCGGASLLLDYSGIVMLAGLCLYGAVKARDGAGWKDASNKVALYALGALGPVALLWFYQWRSFGHPFYPGQHWMPPVQWIDVGYQGFSLPQWDLLGSLLMDYRYGLFLTCPLMAFAIVSWWPNRRSRLVPSRELAVMLGLSAALWLFCGAISYTRLQYNTGIRYLAPLFPFLFVPALIVLMRLSWRVRVLVAVASVAQAWCMAMYRDVERGLGLLEPVLRVFTGGFQLPALTVLSRFSGGQYGDYFAGGVSPLPLFALTGALLFVVWAAPLRQPAGKREESVERVVSKAGEQERSLAAMRFD